MSTSFFPGDIVIVVDSRGMNGYIGVVKGEGNAWDYTVVFPTLDNDTFRFEPESLRKITLEQLIRYTPQVPAAVLDFLH